MQLFCSTCIWWKPIFHVFTEAFDLLFWWSLKLLMIAMVLSVFRSRTVLVSSNFFFWQGRYPSNLLEVFLSLNASGKLEPLISQVELCMVLNFTAAPTETLAGLLGSIIILCCIFTHLTHLLIEKRIFLIELRCYQHKRAPLNRSLW